MTHQLSLWAAILININIMVGIGIFLNTTLLSSITGAAGFVSYTVLAVLLLPLILSIAKLVNIFPKGGFYIYAKMQISELAGFISAWSYFVGKLASAMLMIHASVLLLQQVIPAFQCIGTFTLDITILVIFLGLNLLNLQTGQAIQTLFLVMKLIPITFIICTGLFLFSPGNYTPEQFQWHNFMYTLPLVLYTAVGFEATTSISRKLKNPERDGPLAILCSYAFVMCINIIFQLLLYSILGEQLAQAKSFLDTIPLLLAQFFSLESPFLYTLQGIFNIAIASSALGGAYGILFSNSWNLYTLAEHGHILKANLFLALNKYQIPFLCIITEGLVCGAFLLITQGSQIPLQQITAFGCTIAYTLSVLSLILFLLSKQVTFSSLLVPFLGLINCLFLLGSCINSFFYAGAYSLLMYGLLMAVGITTFFYTGLAQKASS